MGVDLCMAVQIASTQALIMGSIVTFTTGTLDAGKRGSSGSRFTAYDIRPTLGSPLELKPY
jgi:hypothetical protein